MLSPRLLISFNVIDTRPLICCAQWVARLLRAERHRRGTPRSTWLAAWSRVQLGTLAILRHDQRQARAVLDEALDLSVAARSTGAVTLCLAAYAGLASAEGDPRLAALLAGAAEGMRRRAGLRVWPTLRQSEDELAAQVRQTLGPERFDQAFSAGSGLSLREAVAAVRKEPSTGSQTP